MCGRFNLRASAADISRLFGVPEDFEIAPRFNIAPTQPIVVIREVAASGSSDDVSAEKAAGSDAASLGVSDTHAPRRQAALMHWGLVPHWADDPAIGSKMINARAETIAQKPAFRAAFRRRRCLIPASGFYEWQKTPQGKQPYHVFLPDEPVFAFAGLWERWSSNDGSELESCTIITTAANQLLAEIHNRMPVIVDRNDYDLWLGPADDPAKSLQPLLRPFPADRMAMTPVSRRVNNPRNDDPQCLEPPQTQNLF